MMLTVLTAAATPPVARRNFARLRGGALVPPSVSRLRGGALVPPSVSLLSGMMGGAVGYAVAFPIDTINTRIQLAQPLLTTEAVDPYTEVVDLYSGVSATVVGSALTKGSVFLAYGALQHVFHSDGSPESLALAAAFAGAGAGAAASFVVTPVERVKLVMQSQPAADASAAACAARLAREEGVGGLLGHGLGATCARDIPAYAIEFVVYELLKAHILAAALLPPPLVPLVGGAVAGAACWVPTYPLDVIKTHVQAGKGDGFAACARRLHAAAGPAVFWQGLAPKLLRTLVAHATTFAVAEALCCAWSDYCVF